MNDKPGPATPGTAARCETCNRESWNRHAAVTQDWDEARIEASCDGEAECWLLGFERLKAENASLLESLRRAEAGYAARGKTIDAYEEDIKNLVAEIDSLKPTPATRLDILGLELERTPEEHRAGMEMQMARADKLGNENFRLREALAAAKQRNTELEGALREARSAIVEQCRGEYIPTDLINGLLRRIDAALHDEERSAPPPPTTSIPEDGVHCPVCGAKGAEPCTTLTEQRPLRTRHHGRPAAAQGEEK